MVGSAVQAAKLLRMLTVVGHVQVTMQTNYHGPMALTQLLLPTLKESAPSRVVWTSSGLESIGTLPDLSDLDALE